MRCPVDDCANQGVRKAESIVGQPKLCRYHFYVMRHYFIARLLRYLDSEIEKRQKRGEQK